jgi:presenilin-like A22 family membrane protease
MKKITILFLFFASQFTFATSGSNLTCGQLPGGQTILGPWYTYWLNNTLKPENLSYFFYFFILVLFSLWIISLFFKKNKKKIFKKLIKELIIATIFLNIGWFIFANIISYKNTDLNNICVFGYTVNIETIQYANNS